MNDLYKSKEKIWNKRFHECFEASGFSETALAVKMNAVYGTSYSQKSVSDWLNVGNDHKSGPVNFPKLETVINIADFFNVDVGYLIGETDYDSFTIERTADFLALNQDAVKGITNITHPNGSDRFAIVREGRDMMSELLSSDEFYRLASALSELYSVCNWPTVQTFDYYVEADTYAQEVNETIGLRKFHVYESFFKLLDDLYPNAKEEDYLTENNEDDDE